MQKTLQRSPGHYAQGARDSWSVTLSVWKALFLREAQVRLFSKRAGILWIFAEPLANIVVLASIFSVMHVRTLGGIETAVWVMAGMLAFFQFRRTGMIGMRAVTVNFPLFTYRQVKPVDTVLVRVFVEGVIMVSVALLLLAGGGLVGLDIVPGDPLLVLWQFVALWCLGLGFGLVGSVASELVPELGEILSLVMLPLYFLSGVIFPIAVVPEPYRGWMLLNPLVHAIEGVRLGFAPHYHPVQGLDLWYPSAMALLLVTFGLLLHKRFAVRLLAR